MKAKSGSTLSSSSAADGGADLLAGMAERQKEVERVTAREDDENDDE